MKNIIETIFFDHIELAKKTELMLSESIECLCKLVTTCIKNGNKVMLFGNGGSAADAQHIAAEFTGRFVKDRRSLPAIALTTDTSAITSIANDYGYDQVFARQVEGIANKGDILIGISTSGNSTNVIKALSLGKQMGCVIIGLSGNDGGLMNDNCDVNLVVPSMITARIQEMHILIGHIICSFIDTDN